MFFTLPPPPPFYFVFFVSPLSLSPSVSRSISPACSHSLIICGIIVWVSRQWLMGEEVEMLNRCTSWPCCSTILMTCICLQFSGSFGRGGRYLSDGVTQLRIKSSDYINERHAGLYKLLEYFWYSCPCIRPSLGTIGIWDQVFIVSS